MRAIFLAAAFTVVFRADCGFETCFTARFAMLSTAATAPRTKPPDGLDCIVRRFLTFFSRALRSLFLGLRLLAQIGSIGTLVGLDVLELPL